MKKIASAALVAVLISSAHAQNSGGRGDGWKTSTKNGVTTSEKIAHDGEKVKVVTDKEGTKVFKGNTVETSRDSHERAKKSIDQWIANHVR